MRRFVALTPVRVRRHIRAVGFQQQPVQRNEGRRKRAEVERKLGEMTNELKKTLSALPGA